jgi:hypothetical protein
MRAECWWLTSVILATWEAKIRRTVVPGQPGHTHKKKFARSHLNRKKLGVMVCGCHPQQQQEA